MRISPEPGAIFTNFLCMLPMSVVRSSSGMFTIGCIAYWRQEGHGSAQRGRSVICDCLVFVSEVFIISGYLTGDQFTRSLFLNKDFSTGLNNCDHWISNELLLNQSCKEIYYGHMCLFAVFDILLRYTETGSWKDAFFRVIPRRKQVESCRSIDVNRCDDKASPEIERAETASLLQSVGNVFDNDR